MMPISILKIYKEFIAKNIISAKVWTWNLSAYPGRAFSQFEHWSIS